MSSRLLSLLAAAILAVVLFAGDSFAGASAEQRSLAPGPAAVSPVEVGEDSEPHEGMGESCEKMHQEMMGGMSDDMRRMHDEMMGEMDRTHPGS